MTRKGGHCDLCHAALEVGQVIYVHATPSTGTLAEAEADKNVQWFEDPHWAACYGCHRRILALDGGMWERDDWIAMMTRRSLLNQVIVGSSALSRRLREEQLGYIVKVLSSFADYHVPEFYSEVNEGVDR